MQVLVLKEEVFVIIALLRNRTKMLRRRVKFQSRQSIINTYLEGSRVQGMVWQHIQSDIRVPMVSSDNMVIFSLQYISGIDAATILHFFKYRFCGSLKRWGLYAIIPKPFSQTNFNGSPWLYICNIYAFIQNVCYHAWPTTTSTHWGWQFPDDNFKCIFQLKYNINFDWDFIDATLLMYLNHTHFISHNKAIALDGLHDGFQLQLGRVIPIVSKSL